TYYSFVSSYISLCFCLFFFFFNDTSTTVFYTLSLHDALPICLLQSVNQMFYDNTAESAYATLFFAEYDDNEQRLRYVNCGHLSRSEEHTSELQSRFDLVCRLLLEKKKKKKKTRTI